MVRTHPPTIVPVLHCIVNPAGRDRSVGRRWPQVKAKLEAAGFDVVAQHTEGPGDAARMAWALRDELDAGEMVVAVGGDGTAHEVASGLRGSELVLGIVPIGSGNDLARTHGYTSGDVDAAISILREGHTRHVPALRLIGHPAAATKGYPEPVQQVWDGEAEDDGRITRWVFQESDAGVTARTSRTKLTRGRWLRGELKYLWLGVVALMTDPLPRVRIQLDDEPPASGRLVTMVATLGETFGSGMRITPGSHPGQDGCSVLTVLDFSRLRIMGLMGPMRKGRHIGRRGVALQTAHRIRLTQVDKEGEPVGPVAKKPTFIQADGEPCLTLPAEVSWHGGQLHVRGAASVEWDAGEPDA